MPDQQQAFSAQRIYLKDISFESPNAPAIFLDEWEPEINVEMDNTVDTVDEAGVYDVQLKVTVTAKLGDKIAYIAEVVQGGIFLATGFNDEDRQRLTGSVCPDMLYPYARAAMSDLITQGSFPAFLLSPVNFGYIYGKRLEGAKAAMADQPDQEAEQA